MRGTITRGPGGVDATLFDQTLSYMRSGNAYVNVHTTQNSAGEIRGQFGVKGGFALGRGENNGGGAETDDDAKPQKQRGQGQGQGQGRGRGHGGQGDND